MYIKLWDTYVYINIQCPKNSINDVPLYSDSLGVRVRLIATENGGTCTP